MLVFIISPSNYYARHLAAADIIISIRYSITRALIPRIVPKRAMYDLIGAYARLKTKSHILQLLYYINIAIANELIAILIQIIIFYNSGNDRLSMQ